MLSGQGQLKIDGELKHLSSALAHQRIGLEETDDGIWAVFFCKEHIAHYNERTRKIER